MTMSVAAFAVALIAAAGAPAAPRPTGEAKLAKMLEGRTPGRPVGCLNRTPASQGSSTIEGVGLVYGRGRTLYVNRFEGGCPSLTAFSTVVTRTPTTQLCRGDIARIVDLVSRIEGGSCVLGDFVPYERAGK
jgi:hypothetical protein